jgi:hypothetical protein
MRFRVSYRSKHRAPCYFFYYGRVFEESLATLLTLARVSYIEVDSPFMSLLTFASNPSLYVKEKYLIRIGINKADVDSLTFLMMS